MEQTWMVKRLNSKPPTSVGRGWVFLDTNTGDIGDAKRTPTHNLQYALSKKQVSMCDAKKLKTQSIYPVADVSNLVCEDDHHG